jgi:hypothetical protein
MTGLLWQTAQWAAKIVSCGTCAATPRAAAARAKSEATDQQRRDGSPQELRSGYYAARQESPDSIADGIVTLIDRSRVMPEWNEHSAVMLPSGRTSPHSKP